MNLYRMLFIGFILTSLLSSCSLYKSPDRKDFESNAASFKVQNLTLSGCSNSTLKNQASASKLISVLSSEQNNESVFLWEYKINSAAVFETDNLQGVYCLYENN